MINKKIYLSLAIAFSTFSVFASGPTSLNPIDGYYLSSNNYNLSGSVPDPSWVSGGRENGNYVYVCAGNGSAKTPGKLINGKCYYANNGDEHRNTTYHILINQGILANYRWMKASEMSPGASAITTRDWDAGDYIYHCLANPSLNGNDYVGKYLPGTGKCYWSYYGDEKSTSDASKFKILIPNN
jgi:hypothetical protein